MVIRKKKEKVVKVFPCGSEEQQRYERVLEILFEADKKRLDQLFAKKREKEQRIDKQIEESHEKKFQKIQCRSVKKYNLTQTARILRVHRQTLYYWIKKKQIKPRRDFKGYPVFTVLDIERLIEWKNLLRADDVQKREKRT
ncbi:helix-turn-helix domain-containing protein [Candidatus Omnitrophota bacterium]